MDSSELSRRMRIARAVRELGQADLAVRLHADGWIKSGGREQISEVENGKRKLPPKVLEAIEEICQVPPGFLTDETVELVTVLRTVLVTGRTVTVNEDGRSEVMDVEEAHRRGLISGEALASVTGQAPPPRSVPKAPAKEPRRSPAKRRRGEAS